MEVIFTQFFPLFPHHPRFFSASSTRPQCLWHGSWPSMDICNWFVTNGPVCGSMLNGADVPPLSYFSNSFCTQNHYFPCHKLSDQWPSRWVSQWYFLPLSADTIIICSFIASAPYLCHRSPLCRTRNRAVQACSLCPFPATFYNKAGFLTPICTSGHTALTWVVLDQLGVDGT